MLFVAPETSRRLSQPIGTLAVLAPLLDELDIAGIIDAHIPCDDQQHLSHGKALLALLAARLSCPQALVHVQQWAGQHALDVLWNIETDKLNDDRLGRSLDAFFEHRYAILTAITHRALELAQMDMTRVHFDPTDVTFAGRYDCSRPRDDDHFERLASDIPLSPAHIGKGYLTDRRMLHVATTSVVDEKGALPIFANLVDGNRNGHTAVAQQFELLKHSMRLPEGTQMVSDRGTYSAEHIARLQAAGYTFLGPVPWNDYRGLYDANAQELVWQEASYLSQEQQRRRACDSSLPTDHYELASIDHELTDDVSGQTIACRLIFAYSTQKARDVAERRTEDLQKIQKGLCELAQKVQAGHPRTTKASVLRRVEELLAKKDAGKYFSYQLVALTKDQQAALPRPKKGHRRATEQLVWHFDEQAAKTAGSDDGLMALVTTAPESKSIDTLFSEYKQQAYVELGHHQLKGPLAVSPVFLKKPERVESLLCLLHVAAQGYQLLERMYRHATPESGPKSETLMTSERILRAFEGYAWVVENGPDGRVIHPGRLNRVQRDMLDRLGLETPTKRLFRSLPLAPPEEKKT